MQTCCIDNVPLKAMQELVAFLTHKTDMKHLTQRCYSNKKHQIFTTIILN